MTDRRFFNADAALEFYPFDGDETDVTQLTDKIVVAAKMYPHCQICHGPIEKGERHRALTERNNEEKIVQTFRFCGKCCRAMAHHDCWDGARLIQSRYSIGHHRREAHSAHPDPLAEV